MLRPANTQPGATLRRAHPFTQAAQCEQLSNQAEKAIGNEQLAISSKQKVQRKCFKEINSC